LNRTFSTAALDRLIRKSVQWFSVLSKYTQWHSPLSAERFMAGSGAFGSKAPLTERPVLARKAAIHAKRHLVSISMN